MSEPAETINHTETAENIVHTEYSTPQSAGVIGQYLGQGFRAQSAE
jgi:hypothetical protein